MKTIFVSGSTGFVGSLLTKNLVQLGYNIHALYRSEQKVNCILHPQVKIFKGSIHDKESLRKAMYGCGALFHTAACVGLWRKNKEVFYETNVKGTQNVIEVAREMGIQRGIFTSSAGVLGPSSGRKVTEEDVNTMAYMSDYEKSKQEADEIIFAANSSEFETIIVYPTRIYGPGIMGRSNRIVKMIEDYIKGKWHIIPGDGMSLANYVFVDDVVKGHILALEKGRGGEGYLLSGSTVSYNEFFSMIKEISGKKYFLIKIPASIMYVIASVMYLLTKLTGVPPLVTYGFIRKALSDWDVSNQKAFDELEYSPTSIYKALRITIDWINNQCGNSIFMHEVPWVEFRF